MRLHLSTLIGPAVIALALLPGPVFAQSDAPANGPPGVPANSQTIQCSQLDDAQHFVDGLKPGPNSTAAQQHIDAAREASGGGDDKQCVAELTKANDYARRSAAADKEATSGHHHHARHALCADALHQDRPGGTDYHGPAVAGCKRVL